MLHTLAIGMPGLFEWIIIGGLGLLIFGKRLPEVGRGVGQMIVNFKRGMRDVETEVEQIDEELDRQPSRRTLPANQPAQSDFKFDPYTGKPVESSSTNPAGKQ